MVEFVTRHLVARIMHGALLCASMLWSEADAQMLVDPTRPPGAPDGSDGDANKAPVVQSILIGTGRREAIINGRTVKVGDQFGEARVMAIGDSEVVLRNGAELQTLKLFPAIEKQMAASQSGMNASVGRQEK